MTVNSVFNVILPFNNCDSIPPLKLRSQGINPGSPAIQGLISPRKATLVRGVPADLSCSSVLYLSGVMAGKAAPACHSPAATATAHINKGTRGSGGFAYKWRV